MSRPLHAVVRHAARKIFLNIDYIKRKGVISKFADKLGLVCFGSVDQHCDDHTVVRGFTVSASHQDTTYCVGSINGYNVAIVDRNDSIWQPDNSIVIQNWLIMSFDLHTKVEIPHFFLGARNHDNKPHEALFTAFPSLKQVHIGTFEQYDSEFMSRFALYSQPATSIEVERLFPAKSARVLGVHFWPFSAEQDKNKLYIYADNMKITPGLLDVMIQNGLWLAENLDTQAEITW